MAKCSKCKCDPGLLNKAIEVIKFTVKQSGTSTDYNKLSREFLENNIAHKALRKEA